MSSSSAFRGRVVIFVVGFDEYYWQQHAFGEEHQIVDVRKWMPRDPAASRSMRKMKLCDFIVKQDGFVPATFAIVKRCIQHGRCISGSQCNGSQHICPPHPPY